MKDQSMAIAKGSNEKACGKCMFNSETANSVQEKLYNSQIL